MTSVTEDSYLPSSSKAQFNGEVEGENISSIHNNIFYKTFGKPVKYPTSSSSKPTSNNDDEGGDSVFSSTNDNDNDDNMEYRPVSGFVHRLMGRFSKGDQFSNAQASSSSSSVSASALSKRSSSLEDLSTENDASKRNVSFEEPAVTYVQKPSAAFSSNLSHRARSIESLNAPSRKPQPHSQSRPLAIPQLRHVETKQGRDKPLKSPRESKVIAPDVDLANDDIIIIENTPSVPALQLSADQNKDDSGSDFETPQLHSYREEMLPEELPKPNTVLNVRSIFETAASVSATVSSLAHRRRRSDSSDISVEKSTQGSSLLSGPETNTNTNLKISNRNSSSSISSPTTVTPVLSPRVISNEPSTAPVFKLDQSSKETNNKSYSSQRSSVSDLYSPYYKLSLNDDKSVSSTTSSTTTSTTTTATPLPPTSYTRQLSSSRQSTPRDDNNKDSWSSSTSSSAPSSARSDIGLYPSSSTSSSLSSSTETSTKSPSVVERGSLFDSRPAPSPRSTASVKPTIVQNPPAAVKPIPLSAPASAATSYKKSSPVVPVAPFKKTEEAEDDGTPVLIYQKSKSPRRKPERQNLNHSQINGKQVKNDEKDDLIIQKDAKSVFEKEKKNNFGSSDFNNKTSNNDILKRSSNIENEENGSKATDEGNNRSHTSVISVTKEKTVINLTRTSTDDNQDSTKTNLAPSVPTPARPPRSNKIINNKNNNTNNVESTKKSRPAPLPPKSSSVVEEQKKSEDKKEGKREGSMIYVSSSDSETETDSSTPPETPRTQPPPPPVPREPPPIIPPSPREPPFNSTIIPISPREPPTKTPEPVASFISISSQEPVPVSKPREPLPSSLSSASISPSPRESPKIPRDPPSTSPSPLKPRIVPKPETNDESKEQPIKGIPSIIAKRLNKQNNSPRELSDAIIEGRDSSGRDSPDGGFAVTLRKTSGSPSIVNNNKNDNDDDSENKRDSVSNDIEAQIANMRKKMDNSRNRSGSGATQIFDSSQLAQKRKERKEAAAKAAAAAATSSQGMVPPLDFSGLNDNNRNNPGNLRRKEIKPCNIKFIGENAKTSRNLLKKKRKVKINIQFKSDISELFEYPSEDVALQTYLEEHPNEPEELDEEDYNNGSSSSSSKSNTNGSNGVMFLDSFGGGESTDDVDDDDDDVSNDVSTPRGGGGSSRRDDEEDGLKSNPALSSTSTLQSYRGRFQEEFVFGSHRQEPEPVVTKQEPEPVEDPDSMMLRPAEEETIDPWSTSSSSDLLF